LWFAILEFESGRCFAAEARKRAAGKKASSKLDAKAFAFVSSFLSVLQNNTQQSLANGEFVLHSISGASELQIIAPGVRINQQ
jgi:hypothetical protein